MPLLTLVRMVYIEIGLKKNEREEERETFQGEKNVLL